jgi:uncharacterized membrane protein
LKSNRRLPYFAVPGIAKKAAPGYTPWEKRPKKMLFDMLDWVAFFWFLCSWIGYTIYAKKRAHERASLSALLYEYRIGWMKNTLSHENRVPDYVLIGNLTQMGSFLASTSILVIAGIVTIIYSADSVVDLLADHRFVVTPTQEQVQFKLIVLGLIFVFAFFKLTWSMRQHTFCNIMLGSAPYVPPGRELTPAELEFAALMGKISDRAGHEFNYGLRSYYFGLAVLTWFINPYVFMLTCAVVVFVLYMREFRSTTLKYLILARDAMRRMDDEKLARADAAPVPAARPDAPTSPSP